MIGRDPKPEPTRRDPRSDGFGASPSVSPQPPCGAARSPRAQHRILAACRAAHGSSNRSDDATSDLQTDDTHDPLERGMTLVMRLNATMTNSRPLSPALVAGLIIATAMMSLAGTAAAEGEDLARGEQLFALCTQCHGSAGEGKSEALAPAIAGMPGWYVEAQLKNFKSGIRGLHAKDTGGLRMYPMSQWLVTEADQKAVAAYVASLPVADPPHELDENGDAARGAGYYAVCSACHGPAGQGNQGMGAPPLVGQSDWYLYSSIKKYKQAIRGSGKGDPFGAAMIGMVATLPDDAAILDVIAHIQSFEN